MTGALLIRVDGGSDLGLGHAMRMLALGEAWVGAGGRVTYLGALPAGVVERAARSGCTVLASAAPRGTAEDAAATRATAEKLAAVWVVADGYDFDEAWQRTVKASGARLAIVDDNGENGSYAADAIVNVNVHASEALYPRRPATTQLLLGPRYALVRAEFVRAARGTSTMPVRATKWLVTMGGADPSDATGRFLDAAAKGAGEGITIEVLVAESNPRWLALQQVAARSATPIVLTRSPPDVSVPMGRAELAFSASGGTVWELAVVGVPVAVLTVADNQRRLATRLHELGAVEWLGDAASTEPSSWVRSVQTLAGDLSRRAALVERARQQVDGEGAARVVNVLREVKR